MVPHFQTGFYRGIGWHLSAGAEAGRFHLSACLIPRIDICTFVFCVEFFTDEYSWIETINIWERDGQQGSIT